MEWRRPIGSEGDSLGHTWDRWTQRPADEVAVAEEVANKRVDKQRENELFEIMEFVWNQWGYPWG